MALSNRDRIDRGLAAVRAGLRLYVLRELKDAYGDRWRDVVAEKLKGKQYTRIRNSTASEMAFLEAADEQALFTLMLRCYDDVFFDKLSHPGRSQISELITVRNKWAHREDVFTLDDTQIALHTMGRLLKSVSARPEAEEVHKYRKAVLRQLFESEGFVAEPIDDLKKNTAAAFANTAPPIPPNFVPRREELDELRRAVIGERDTDPVALTGLRGMGGIGKTALAISLCHDDGLREIFPDGVVWVDIGREPGNLVGQMRRVGQALGDGPGYYDTPEGGTDRLRILLRDKAVLLVLDDVWDASDVEPFIVDAPRCRVLFTTRNADIVLRLDAREIPLDVLAPEQAISLLREWTGRGEPAFPEIADRLGYLPLALKLAGARLREGMSGAEWLETFQRVSQMKLSRRSTDPQENLLDSFELSVHELPAEDRRLYYPLGIFPEDVRIPQSVVARLWGQLSPEISQFDCDELVTELAQLALIERNADDKTVTLHDLLREYTREQLGDELEATHAALLSAYNPDGKPWPRIEHDGYLYHHLAYHLREAGRKEELYELLTGTPDWMEAKFVACTGNTAYVADLDLAIGDFADSSAAAEVLTVVKLYTARQVVNARVSSYSKTDLRTLVWLGREDEALAHARLRSETKDKFDGLLTVYRTLEEKGRSNLSLLHEVQELARSIGDERRAFALGCVAAALAQAERYEEAREVARSIGDDERRADALRSVASALAEAERFNYALAILGLHGLDVFLQALAEWALPFEQVESALSITVLREATGIAGWVRSDWRKIHELLNS